MIRSMTGYGKSVCELNDRVITIEIKALNSKQLDIYTRVPTIYREKDMEMRNLVSQHLKRGKIELGIVVEITDAKNAGVLNIPVIKEYYNQLKTLGNELDIDYNESIFQVLLRLPDSLKADKEELDPEDWKSIQGTIVKALNSVDSFRIQEGNALKLDILSKVDNIIMNLNKIIPFEKDRIENIRKKLESGLNEISDIEKIDNNRFEQELIYYLEKLDINEEKVRLQNHCNFFKEVCGYEEPVGKKLGFIAQEMGREINTIGSKANHSEIQKHVVLMKDELEKIKEQSLNIL